MVKKRFAKKIVKQNFQPKNYILTQWFPTCGPQAKSGLKMWPSTSKIILKIYVQQLQNSHFDRVGQWGMSRYAHYGENN